MPSPNPTYTPDDIAHLEWFRSQYRDIYARLQAAVQKHNLATPLTEPEFLDKIVIGALDRLITENAQLREDKARLEAANGHLGELACHRHDRILQLERDLINEKTSHSWTAAREQIAIDNAKKKSR